MISTLPVLVIAAALWCRGSPVLDRRITLRSRYRVVRSPGRSSGDPVQMLLGADTEGEEVMLADLVQISSGSWVDPAEVKRIYTCKSSTEGEPDHTYVVCTSLNRGGGAFGFGDVDHVISSDWPIGRIHAALGLISADDLGAQVNPPSPVQQELSVNKGKGKSMADYDYRRFEDIPDRTVFADKYGRVHTKQSPSRATAHPSIPGDGYSPVKIDTSREYFEYDEETADDDPFVFDTWPYYALPNEKPMPA